MNTVNISQKAKNKHLNFSHYEFIINSLIQFNASHPGKRNGTLTVAEPLILKNVDYNVIFLSNF